MAPPSTETQLKRALARERALEASYRRLSADYGVIDRKLAASEDSLKRAEARIDALIAALNGRDREGAA